MASMVFSLEKASDINRSGLIMAEEDTHYAHGGFNGMAASIARLAVSIGRILTSQFDPTK
ncbi:hypothetical protein Tco_0186199, partial [Tanacetum coccineum]